VHRRLFLLIYFASGCAALIYEVAWTRMLSLQLGHTVAATSTVLAAFMGGLAAGATIAGGARWKSLRAYAALEVTVAICAAALPFALAATTPLLAWAYADGTAPVRLAIVRVVVSGVILGLPAAAMGATYPVASEWFSDPGMLYAANTAGAALGAVAAGFWLIPAAGLRATTGVGIVLNLIAAAAAFSLAARTTTINAESAESAERPLGTKMSKKGVPRVRRVPRRSSVDPALAWVAVAVSGFAALVYEVAWTRLLALVIGPTTYAFATMAAAFIGGLAVGSAIGTRIARRTAQPAAWLMATLIAGASAAVPAAWWAAMRLPLAIAAQVAAPNVDFSAVVWSQAMQVALLLLPMTAALGATFPLALAAAAGGDVAAGAADTGVGRNAARVYTANTIGAIAGALAGGFVLIPRLGLRGTFTAAAAVALATAIACLARLSRRALAIGATAATAALVAAVLLPAWDRGLLSSGGYKYAPYIASGGVADLDRILRAGTLEYYKEGAAGTVSVRTLTGTRSLAIDGKIDASNAGDMLTQRLLGLLPVLIHGRARAVAVIGLGSGVTTGSALVPGTAARVDVIEISPEVVEASRFFDPESGAVLTRPEVRLIVGDGRSHLRLSSQRYDVIISEPSNPWMAGVASLFTREFFEAARARLETDGILCQWAHTYDISAADLRSIVRTFGSVFPDGSMWLVGEGDLLLIGSRRGSKDGSSAAPITSRLDAINRARDGAVASMLAGVGMAPGTAPFDLLSLYVGGPAEITKYSGGALIQTDDYTPLEYTAPRGIFGSSSGDNAAALRALAPELPPAVAAAIEGATAADWLSRGRMELQAEAPGIAYDAFRNSVDKDTRNETALTALTEAATGSGRQTEERAWLESVARREPANAAVRIELSRLLANEGNLDAAVQTAAEAARLAPDDPRTLEQLASVVSDAGDLERLQPVVDTLAARFPARLDGQYYRASVLFQRGRIEEAASAADRIVRANPADARAQNLLGAACARLGRRDCARSAFAAALAANPRNPSTYVNLGLLAIETGDPESAARYFSEALTLDPRSAPARGGLTQARSLLGDPR
jgi:spermidine synthase